MTKKIVSLFGGSINGDGGSNGNNGSNLPPIPPEPNNDDEERRRRRRLWQLHGMAKWQKELFVVQNNLKDLDMLILAWRRGLLSHGELNRRMKTALRRVNLQGWGYHTSWQIGSFSVYLNHE